VVTLQVEINSISEASAHYSQKQRGRGGEEERREGRKKRKRGESAAILLSCDRDVSAGSLCLDGW
jgi:hypothetical protein